MLLLLCAFAQESDLQRPADRVVRAGKVSVRIVTVNAPVATELRIGDRVLVDVRYRPDRVALSADGSLAGFVSGKTGLSSVWVVRTDGSSAPRQLTNLGLSRTHREGFVPPPIDTLTFEGNQLVWQDGVGTTHRVLAL